MSNRVFVGNLKFEITDEELRDAFVNVGPVASLEVIRDAAGRAKFAFVEMANEADAETAIENLRGFEIRGRAIRCEPAKSQSRNDGEKNREGAGHARPGARRWQGVTP